ncbi:MAG: ribonuclease D [Rhodospirillaceae bacterium]|nr:ribonuclease D [Rhodospirillaceae bacterium]|tara:strand:- start:405 stop:1562 length:1158 start_codon:yes stop_codon:yes gene_type:complete
MSVITTTEDLADLCARLHGEPFIAIDTEFMRESTFWPRLCLVQVNAPGIEAVAIDPLAEGIDLSPLFAVMTNEAVLKVFHAGRQDIEIFYHLTGRIPAPIFDTQIAAMVCGFGEAASYETLARKLARVQVDKASRFTDWSKRPLTDRQIRYALGDVEALEVIYEKLSRRLDRTGRGEWVDEELAILTDPATYDLHPEESWRRIRTRSAKPRFLAVLREVAAVRERVAQDRDIPRSRVLRDEALLEIAAQEPQDVEALARTRGLGRGQAEGSLGRALLEAVAKGMALPEDQRPQREAEVDLPRGIGPLVELLKVLLKFKSEQHDVAQRLVASAADLELLAAGENVRALHGWRHDIFGADAIALREGRLALAAEGNRIRLVALDSAD